jgi:hypothetical protein
MKDKEWEYKQKEEEIVLIVSGGYYSVAIFAIGWLISFVSNLILVNMLGVNGISYLTGCAIVGSFFLIKALFIMGKIFWFLFLNKE